MNSILELKNIYNKYNKQFLKYVEKVVDDIKRPESVVNKKELNEYIFNQCLYDLNLSKYSSKKIFNIIEIDPTPDSISFYGDDAKDIDDTELDENEKIDNEFIKNVNIIYNKTLATTIWENVMIYGGGDVYKEMLNKIIEDVEKINPKAAKKMNM